MPVVDSAPIMVRPAGAPEYPVFVERDWERLFADGMIEALQPTKLFVLSQRSLQRPVLDDLIPRLNRYLPGGADDPRLLYMGEGEDAKRFSELESLLSAMVRGGVDRRSLLLACGGGVVGDFGGFAAALLLRGISFVQLPTTLLAAVDSSVGGKTAVNIGVGKNMVGAFHHPRLVYFNQSLLRTLPERERRCGLAEMVKHACLAEGGQLLSDLERDREKLRDPGSAELNAAIRDSIRFKASIVAADEREAGLRGVLNLGHTTGHAIESLTGYGAVLHGEAVARGLVTALLLSRRLMGFPGGECERVLKLMSALELPGDTLGLSARALYEHMQFDKKTKGDSIRFVLLRAIGQPLFDQPVSFADFSACWQEQQEIYG